MSADLFASVNGYRLTAVNMTVPNVGPWVAECDFEGEPSVSGRVMLTLGTLKALGTVSEPSSGTFAAQRKIRIVGGAGGWATVIGAKSYANDGGVKARTVVEDAARAVGETIGDFVPAAERVGSAYVRNVGPASRVLDDMLGGVAWWIDYAGVTQAGPRPTRPLAANAYQVLAYDPRDRIVTLGVDDPAAVTIGSVLSERLDTPQTVRSLEIKLSAGELRVHAWCNASDATYSPITGLFRAIAQRATDGRLFGAYRYRVVRMVGKRVELQAVRRAAGVPDLLRVSVWPGVAGAVAELAGSAECLVSFIEGDRAQPFVCAFAGADGNGFVPAMLTLGGELGPAAARLGDPVVVTLPPASFAGTVGGSPATGTVTWAAPQTANGRITGGSSKVRIA